jgi:hypothetical protein
MEGDREIVKDVFVLSFVKGFHVVVKGFLVSEKFVVLEVVMKS